MKKFLLSLVSLLMVVLFAQAGEVKIAYPGGSTTNMTGENDAASFGLSKDDWSIVGAKGGNSNYPGLNKAGDFRLYYHKDGGNTITVTVLKEGAVIKKITGMSFNTGLDNVTVSVGGELVEPVDGAYTINATSFVLGNGNTSNVQVQIKEITLDVEGLGSSIAAPVITPNGGTFLETQEVTFSCETEGAAIYYTIDGSDPANGNEPSESATRYERTLLVTQNTTVRAVAFKDGTKSAEATATFTQIQSYSTLTSMSALENNTPFVYNGQLIVTAKPTDKHVYVYDNDKGFGLIYDDTGKKTAACEKGRYITPGWLGKVSIYQNLFELVPDEAIAVNEAAPQPFNYQEEPISEANINKVVLLKGVTSFSANGKNLSIILSDGKELAEATDGVKGYNNFGIEIPAAEEEKTYEIIGAVGKYNDQLQFWPITIQEQTEPTPEPELGFYVAGSMTEWSIVAANKMTMDEELERTKHIKEFSLTMSFKANDGIKVASSYGVEPINWFPAGSGNEYVVEADGEYTVYCRPNFDGDETWIEKCLKVVPVAAPATVQSFKLNCARGYVAGDGTKLAGVADAESASVFAIIPYNEDTYLYDVTNKKFVCHTTDEMAGTTGNAALESDRDFSKIVKGVKLGNTEIEAYPYYLEDSWTNWLNMDGGKNVYMNTWKNFEGGAGGNTYAITVVDEDFDATEAIARLEEYYNPTAFVRYVISDEHDVVFSTDFAPAFKGDVISTLPDSYKRSYCTYNVTETTIKEGKNDVNVTVSYELPITLSTSYDEATWYYATLRGSKYVRADESAKDANGRYSTSTTNEKSNAYKWAFVGNPYKLSIINKEAGEAKVLYAADQPVMQEADPATDVKARWILAPNSDGFSVRSESGATLYINDAGGAGNLGYWNSSLGATDVGSKWAVEAVPATDVVVTYKVVLDGNVIATKSAGAQVGGAVNVPSVLQNDFVTALTPDKETISADGEEITVTATLGELPFQISTSYADAKWYYMNGHANDANRFVSTNGDATVWAQGNGETDAYMWAFLGTPYGIQLINKAAGAEKFLQATNPATMGETAKGWVLKKQTNTTFACGDKGFGLWDAGLTYLNTQSGTLKYWSSFDQGSTYWVTEVPPMYAIVIADGILNGTISANRDEAPAGKTITLTITPDRGYVLDELSVKNGEEDIEVSKSYTFEMPAAEVLVTASFMINPDLLPALTAEIEKAEALKTEARTEGLEEFEAAIATAKGALEATDPIAIVDATEALQAAETAFLTANLPVAEGMYYLYNTETETFLSRGSSWGTRATADAYGVAIKVAVADLPNATYTLTGFDNAASYGEDGGMYSDKSGEKVRQYAVAAVEGGFTLTNTDNSKLVYVNNEFIANHDGEAEQAASVWLFVTPAERDEMIAAREAAEKSAAFTAAGLVEAASVELAEPTELTFATGSAWVQTVVREQKDQPATNANGTEMWQATGNYTQTVADLAPGLYKLSIQAFYRNGGADDCVARYETGYNTVLAYLEANGNKIQVKSWATDKGEGNNPNSMAEAKAKFDEGKYIAEGFAYVGEDGILNLKVNNPAHIGNGWFIVNNVKYAKASQDDALLVEAEVMASDAEAVAVGKLLDAIEAYKAEKDAEALKAAMDQFREDNADAELDVTDKVGTSKESWTVGTGNNSNRGTYTKGDITLVEHYGETDPGVMLSQEVNVDNGLYNVEVYATSHNAWNNYGANLQTDADDVAYVFATSGEYTLKTWITARRNSGMLDIEPEKYPINGVEVADGKITIGLALAKAGQTEWHCIQIASLKQITTAKSAYAADKATMATDIATAQALVAENPISEAAALTKAIEAASEALTNNKLTLPEFEAAMAEMKAAIKTFEEALAPYITLAEMKESVIVEDFKYATAAKQEAVKALLEAQPETSAQATEQASSLLVAYRQLIESNVVAEGVKASLITILNPDAENSTDNWTTVLGEGSGGSIGIRDDQPWTGGDGNSTHKYFDGGNWGANAWDVALKQEVALEAGKYMLSVKGRASGDVALKLFAGEVSADIPTISDQGGVFDRGWNETSLEFELTEAATIAIGVQGVTSVVHNWMSFSEFRLVKFIPAVVLNAPTLNAEDGTQAEPKMYPSDFTLKINYSADNLQENGYNAEDLKVKVTVMVSGDLPENMMTMGSTTAHRVLGETFYIDLGETDFPVELKQGYVYQNIVVMSSQLVKPGSGDGAPDEVIATYAGAPAQLHWIGLEAVTYDITIAETANGTVEADKAKAADGEIVTVTIEPAEGYMVDQAYWSFIDETGTEVQSEFQEPEDGGNSAIFTMPAAPVTITVIFKEAPAPGKEYQGLIEQTLTTPEGAVMGSDTGDQTVTITPAGEDLVNITFSGFTFPVMPTTLPKFTIEGVTAVEANGVITYAINDYTLVVEGSGNGQMGGATARYTVNLQGKQEGAEATPVLMMTLESRVLNTVYFGADADAIAAYKQAVGIKNVKGAQNVGTIYDLLRRW